MRIFAKHAFVFTSILFSILLYFGNQSIAETKLTSAGILFSDGTSQTTKAAASPINWRGNWSNSTTYAANDGVSYEGSSYVAKIESLNKLPTDTSYWNLVASKGDTGGFIRVYDNNNVFLGITTDFSLSVLYNPELNCTYSISGNSFAFSWYSGYVYYSTTDCTGDLYLDGGSPIRIYDIYDCGITGQHKPYVLDTIKQRLICPK